MLLTAIPQVLTVCTSH